ncbi:hypothetical protein BDW75DRAFT_205440 [Aspergillus navahoensis]
MYLDRGRDQDCAVFVLVLELSSFVSGACSDSLHFILFFLGIRTRRTFSLTMSSIDVVR